MMYDKYATPPVADKRIDPKTSLPHLIPLFFVLIISGSGKSGFCAVLALDVPENPLSCADSVLVLLAENLGRLVSGRAAALAMPI